MLASTPTAYGPNLLARLLAARSLQQIDDCAKSAWILNGEGLVDDREMAYLVPVIEHQREAIRSPPRFQIHPIGHIPPRLRRRSIDVRQFPQADELHPGCAAARSQKTASYRLVSPEG